MVPSVAVVGATGAVGEIMRLVLDEHAFPFRSIKFLASDRSAGSTAEDQAMTGLRMWPVTFVRGQGACLLGRCTLGNPVTAD